MALDESQSDAIEELADESVNAAVRAICCALAIRDAVRPPGIEIRAGVRTGECELVGEKVGGIAVHIGTRIVARAKPGEVMVSSTVKDCVPATLLHYPYAYITLESAL